MGKKFKYIQKIKGIYKVEISIYTERDEHYVYDMENRNGVWIWDIEKNKDLANEEIIRYKYLLNDGMIRLNDPQADYYVEDCFGEVWSIKEKRDVISDNARVILSKMTLTDRVIDKGECSRVKKFDYKECNKIAMCLELDKIKGVHDVTAIWYQPDGRIYRIESRVLSVYEDSAVSARLWFWVSSQELEIYYMRGIWEVEIYVDGKKETKDNFILKGNICEEYIGFMAEA